MVIGPEYFKPVRRRLNNQISTCQVQRWPWVVELGMRYAHPPGDKLGTPSWCSNGTAKFLVPAGAAFLGSLCVARCCHCCRTMNGNLRVAKPRREEKGIITGVHPSPSSAASCIILHALVLSRSPRRITTAQSRRLSRLATETEHCEHMMGAMTGNTG
ncbi:hypothetical protein HDV62DRAFT_210411 [Trichoderma sp. SZMC 28011]